jgi:hypothetical protein
VALLQHGHELDGDNATPGGNGEMLTRVGRVIASFDGSVSPPRGQR